MKTKVLLTITAVLLLAAPALCDEAGPVVVLCRNGWCALALGAPSAKEDQTWGVGWGYAGNRVDAERHALEQCRRRTKNAKVAISFCTSGVVQD